MHFDLAAITGFDSDQGNSEKSAARHGVSRREAEQVFFNRPLAVVPDVAHSAHEPRFHAYGRSIDGRRLQVAFTLRGGTFIRVISVRDMSRQEKARYEAGPQEG
ncbi:MAG: BrnT family toxin [Bauldia sp.]